jgi:hypothetical protein
VASSAAAALLATVVGSGVALLFAYSHAERERVRAERTLRSFQDALVAANPELGKGSGDMSVAGFLALVEGEVEEALSDEPALLADVLQTIGVVYLGFDNPAIARQSSAPTRSRRRRSKVARPTMRAWVPPRWRWRD